MAEAFRAACMGDLDTVKSCLEGVDAMDINEVDEGVPYATGFTLLLCAVGGDTRQGRNKGHLDVARYLLLKNLVTGVRAAGSFKRYLREPHREFLALRGLAMRGHLAPMGPRRTRGAQKWKAAVAFLARHGDNGVVWNVLSFWRATK